MSDFLLTPAVASRKTNVTLLLFSKTISVVMYKLLLVFLVLLCCHSPANGQFDQEFGKRIPSSMDLVVSIPDFQATLTKITDSSILNHPSLELEIKNLDAATNLLLNDVVAIVNQVESILVTASNEGLYLVDVSMGDCSGFTSLISRLSETFDGILTAPSGNDSGVQKLADKCFFLQKEDGGFLLAADLNLLNSYSNPELIKRPLSRDRRFQKVKAVWKEEASADLYAFVRPNAMDGFFTARSSQQLKMARIDELNASSICVRLEDDFDLLIKQRIFNTRPVSGVAKIWGAEIPVGLEFGFPFEIRGLKSAARDINADFVARQENHDRVTSAGDYLRGMNARYAPYSFKDDILPRTGCRHFVKYVSSGGFRRSMVIEPVVDYRCMENYLKTRVASRNDGRVSCVENRLGERIVPGVLAFSSPKVRIDRERTSLISKIKQGRDLRLAVVFDKWATSADLPSSEAFADAYVVDDGFVLTKDWFVSGDVHDALLFLDYQKSDPLSVQADFGLGNYLSSSKKRFPVEPSQIVFEDSGISEWLEGPRDLLKAWLKEKHGEDFGPMYLHSLARINTADENYLNKLVELDANKPQQQLGGLANLSIAILYVAERFYSKKIRLRASEAGVLTLIDTTYFKRKEK